VPRSRELDPPREGSRAEPPAGVIETASALPISLSTMAVELPQFSEQVGVRLDQTGVRLHSRVEDVAPDRLLLATPSDGVQEVPLPVGADLAVEWVTARGLARVPGRSTGPGRISIPTVSIELLGRPEIFQRREYVRASAALQIEACLTGTTEEFEGLSVDISGGGIRASIPALDAEVGSLLSLWLGLPDKGAEATVKVLRRQDPDVYVLVFEHIAEKERERVIHHVFERLRASAWNH
jgi:c-di-GMP-binding flagellar brake protein YcgR